MKKIILLFLVLSLFSLAASASKMSFPKLPVDVKFYFEETPELNKPVWVVLKFESERDIENVTAVINPVITNRLGYYETLFFNEFQVLEGNLIWNGDLKKGQKISLRAKVIGNDIGYYTVNAVVSAPGKRDMIGGSNPAQPIYIKLTDEEGEIVEIPKNGWSTGTTGCAIGVPIGDFTDINADIDFGFTSLPEPGKKTGLIVTITPKEEMEQLNLGVDLPAGFEVTEVTSSKPTLGQRGLQPTTSVCPYIGWYNAVKQGESIQLTVELYTKKEGWGNVRVAATSDKGKKHTAEEIIILVDEDFTKLSEPLCQTAECQSFDNTIDKDISFIQKIKFWFSDLF